MRPLKRITLILAVLVLLSASGCGRKRVGATYDPFVIFPATAQWAWDEDMNRLRTDRSTAELNLHTVVRDVITEGLAKRDYTMARESGKADFRVYYRVGLGKRIGPDSVKGFGSLSLTVVDVSSNRDVWVGFITIEVAVARSEQDRRRRLQKRVDKMFRKFPPS